MYKIEDLVNVWYNRNIKNKKTETLYKFVRAIKKSSNNITIKRQKLLENMLVKAHKGSYLKIFYYKNNIMKQFYIIAEEGIKKQLTTWYKKDNNIFTTKIINKILKNVIILTYCFFQALAYCIKHNNYLYNTLYSKTMQIIKNDFSIPYKTKNIIIKCSKCKIDISNYVELFNEEWIIKPKSFKTSYITFTQEQSEYITNKIFIAIDATEIIQKVLNENKVREFILHKDLQAYLDRLVLTIMFKPPMLKNPKEWKMYKKKNIVTYSGGYYNDLLLKLNIKFDKRISLKPNFRKAINYIQNIPVQINSNYLQFLLNSKIQILYKEFPLLNELNIKLYLNNDIHKISLNILNIINEIAFTLYFANLFAKFKKIYIPKHYDFRGRIYCTSYPLNYQGHTLYRGLYTFSNNKKIKNLNNFYDFFREFSGNIKLFDLHYKKNKELYSKKDFFLYKSINYAKENAMIGIDACSSTFQIQGMLVKDELMLKLSNVLPNKTKHDIYKYVMTHAYEDIKRTNCLSNIWQNIKTKNGDSVWSNIEDFNDFICKIYKDRILWKGCIMKLGYNQQAKSRSEEILLYIIANYLNILDNKNKNLMKLSFILAVNLESTFYKLFEKQKKLRIFIATATTKITKTNEYIVFKNPQCHNTVWQSYHKEIYKEKLYRSKYIQKIIKVRFVIFDNININKVKIKIATLPNFIQYYDANILIHFILECQKLKLDVKSIHDNFLGHFDDLEMFKKIYINVLCRLFLSTPDPLWEFLINNNLHKDRKMIKLYKEIMGEEYVTIQKNKNKITKEWTYNVIYSQKYIDFHKKLIDKNNKWILTW